VVLYLHIPIHLHDMVFDKAQTQLHMLICQAVNKEQGTWGLFTTVKWRNERSWIWCWTIKSSLHFDKVRHAVRSASAHQQIAEQTLVQIFSFVTTLCSDRWTSCIVLDSMHSCFIFQRCWVQISTQTLDILTEVSMAFPSPSNKC
jgi:hypothetical protein